MVLLSIIILSHNTKDLIIKCLDSIVKQYKSQLQKGEFEIIIVDNASSDQTVETIQQFNNSTINKIKIIQNKKNLGFSKGNNIGAKKATGKYFFFLNSDTEIKDAGFIAMANFLDNNKDIGIVGAKLINKDGSSQASAGKFYNLINVLLMIFGLERLGFLRTTPKEIMSVPWISGGAMMIRANLFHKLSGFDEHFFMYLEDMELCYRAKKESWQTFFYPDTAIVHQQLGSSNRTFAILNIYKGLLYFYKKHNTLLEFSIVWLLLKLKALILWFIGFLSNNFYLKDTYAKAFKIY